MRLKLKTLAIGAVLLLAAAGTAPGQGVQSGIIRGIVTSADGLSLPGATVSIASPALQGEQSATTDSTGGYAFRGLPPGDYTVMFSLSGLTSLERKADVPLGGVAEINVTLQLASIIVTVDVSAQLPTVLTVPTVGLNLKHDDIEALATPRTLEGISQLSLGVNENTPDANQVTINGAFAFDNAFLINGVDVNDNVFAQPQNLFIEDAIQETQVLTSGISAEFGRFTGGVVNAITKSGGNFFSGTFRTNFLNPSWSDETPFEKANGITRTSNLQETYEATLGGPIVKDRLWFFTAGRLADTTPQNTLPQTGIQYTQQDNNRRGEIKFTGTLAPSQTVQVGFLKNSATRTNDSGVLSAVIDPAGLITRERPNQYFTTNYRGALRGDLLVEAQYTQRTSKFQGGGASTSIVDSPFVDLAVSANGLIYNAPYFDTTDPDERNNKQLTGSLTNFWTKAGHHETKAGYEFYRSQIVGGNSQSATGFVFFADYAKDAGGRPVLDSTGRLIPVFTPGSSFVESYPGLAKGAQMNNDSNSLYVQDHWAYNSRWSFDLGARYEHVRSVSNISTGTVTGINNNRIVPRLAAAFDVFGDGQKVIHMTYGQYSGRYNDAQIAGNSPVGNPPFVDTIYQGPAGQGRNFAAGFNLKNYPDLGDNGAAIPTANVFIDPSLKSALVHEFTTSYGENLFNGRGYAEASYVYRKTTSLVEDFFTIADGSTDVVLQGIDAGVFSNKVYRNTDLAHRSYQALLFQSRYRFSKALTLEGHYTLELKNDGNFEGESAGAPGATSIIGNYPEAFSAARNYPDGHLQSFQRGRLRMWSTYTVPFERFGELSVSGLWRYDTGRVYSLVATSQALTATQKAIISAAGYPDRPSTSNNNVYFGDRGSQSFPGYGLFDTSINYNIPVVGSVRPWIKLDIFNLFNNEKLISWNTTVTQDPASPKDALGLATGYLKGPAFGQAVGTANFPAPFNGQTGGRTVRLAFGLRF